MRLFVGIWPTEEGRGEAGALQGAIRRLGLGPAVRFTRPEQCHLTLAFLGEVAEPRVAEVALAVRVAAQGCEAFRLRIAGLGCFPDTRHPRVLWAGVSGDLSPLRDVQRAVAAATDAYRDPRVAATEPPFHPHVTLARLKSRETSGRERRVLREFVEGTPFQGTAGWPVTTVRLMRSDPGSAGAEYAVVAEAGLIPYSR